MQEMIKYRTRKVGLEIIELFKKIKADTIGKVIGGQIIRSAISIGANYRAACRAKSYADFIYKLKIVEEEADETIYWLELLEESKLVAPGNSVELKIELNEILAIVVASIKTARSKVKN
jgi:four helix bundle protein